MPAISCYAPGKTILVGEHAVVYNQPAIAIPVPEVRANVKIQADILAKSGQVFFNAPDINLHSTSENLYPDHPFNIALNLIKQKGFLEHYPACQVLIKSSIPKASGLGSSAAISVALIKSLSTFIGLSLNQSEISDLAFKVEIQYHGTPSGIDNTVIAFDKPICFQKNDGFRLINTKKTLSFILANSGISGQTKKAVSFVRQALEKEPEKYNNLFKTIGDLVNQAEQSISSGDQEKLGMIMTENHKLLQTMGVSHAILDHLVTVANDYGSFGAKLCGGGLGGNIIALVNAADSDFIADKLNRAGATATICTQLIKVDKNG